MCDVIFMVLKHNKIMKNLMMVFIMILSSCSYDDLAPKYPWVLIKTNMLNCKKWVQFDSNGVKINEYCECDGIRKNCFFVN